jgi:hypothetical protein
MINHPSRILWAFFAIVAIIAVWSAASLVSGIEMRALRQRIHYGDPSKLKTPILAQSFVSTHDNLSRIEIRLAQLPVTPIPSDSGLAAELIQGGDPAGTLLYTAPVAASQIITESGAPFLSFPFPPIANSQGMTYTFALQTNGSSINSVLQPAYSPIDALSSGAMYTEDGPQPGDLDIVTYYRYNLLWLAADTWNAISSNLLPIFAWLALFLLPGLALLLWLPNSLSTGQKLMAAPALSALCIPLLYLAASIISIPIGRNKLWALLALCALAIAGRVVSRKSLIVSPMPGDPPNDLRSATYDLRLVAFWAAFVTVMVITIATRLVSLRDIPAGEGIDAYHHTLITALFLRDAGIPTGYAPFAPLASFTYHFGFHSLSATIAWLTGTTQITDLMALVPRVGQIASCVLPIPSLVLFGWRVLGNRWVGLTAGAFTGLLSVVPAFYGEWSRYTQGLGLAVLPVAWIFFIEVLDRTTDDGRQTTDDISRITRSSVVRGLSSIPLAVLSAAGLFLTHYRITIIYVAFVGLYVAWRALVQWKLMRSDQSTPFRLNKYLASIAPDLLNTILIGLLTLLLLLPWLLNLRSNFVTNFIDKSGQNLDAYFATAERLGPAVLSHPSLVWLAILCALGLAVLGWQTWRSEGWGLFIGLIAGVPVIWSALYLYFSHDPIAIEADSRTTLLGLSPVTWLLLLEIVLLTTLVIGQAWGSMHHTSDNPTTLPSSDVLRMTHDESRITYHVSQPSLVLIPALAWLILELWASPQLLPFHLPFVGYLDAVTLTSSAWLPACLLAAYAVVRTWNWVSHQTSYVMRHASDDSATLPSSDVSRMTHDESRITYHASRLARPFLALTCLLFALASGLSLSPVNDRTPFIAQADMEAFAWMRDNLPGDSYILSDSFSFSWSPNQILGGDAGLWLPLTTGLRSSVPPISAYNEKPIDPAYFAQVQALAVARPDPGNEANWQTIEAAGITDIYVGTRSAGDGFDVEGLLSDPHVRLIFHRDGVWLFEITDRKS